MMSKIDTQRIAHLREYGQFWTPAPIAEAMIAYLLASAPNLIFDPAVGMGAFYSALKTLDKTRKTRFYGLDIDPEVIREAKSKKIFDERCSIELRDFVKNTPQQTFNAIIANPPYIRHHRISASTKKLLQEMVHKFTHTRIDGRAGIHVYFLIRALTLLSKGGRLVFIMPADTCEGVFSGKLWNWIASNYCLERVVTFDSSASPFPGIDTNPVIFCISNNSPQSKFDWVRVNKISHEFSRYMSGPGGEMQSSDINVVRRDMREALLNGLSRFPSKLVHSRYKLRDFADIQRGIATGSNEFFFLTKSQIEKLSLPHKYFKVAIGRTRDVVGAIISKGDAKKLDNNGRPTYLLALENEQKSDLPLALREYIEHGEKIGLHKRALISTRRPWYKMEKRTPPPFLFAYLGRRNARFIKNEASVIPLTGFLCVYPKKNTAEYLEALWRVLSDFRTVKNLELVGKSYGSGAIKVEPRALANLPIPDDVVSSVGIVPAGETYDLLHLMDPRGECCDKRRKRKSKNARRKTQLLKAGCR